MRKLLRAFFGERANRVHINNDGDKDWALVKDVCDLMGIRCEYSVVKDLISFPRFNLTCDEKCKFPDPREINLYPVWFVSESGLWKIVARSHSNWAMNFRAEYFLDILPATYRRRNNPVRTINPQ